MTLARLYHRLLLLVGVLALGAYCTADKTPLLAAMAIPAYVTGWWLSSRPEGRLRLPRVLVNAFVAAAVGYAVLRSLRNVEVTAIAQLVVLIQLIKLGDRRTPRDDAQILSLSVFLAIAAMLQSNELWVGAQLIAFLPLLIAVVMVFHLISAQVGPSWPPSVDGSAPADAEAARGLVRAVRVTVALSSIAIVIAAGGVFVIMPRGVGANVLGNWGMQIRGGSETGFTSNVRLGERGVISVSPLPVLDITIRDEQGNNIGGPESAYYLRGAVLDRYENGNWSRDSHTAIERRSSPGQSELFGNPSGPLMEQRINVRAMLSRGGRTSPLFSMYRPVQLQLPGESQFLVFEQLQLLSKVGESPSSYTVWSVLNDPWSETEVRHSPPATFPIEAVNALARKILTDAGIDPSPTTRAMSDDVAAARAFQDFLRKNYAYTLIEAPVDERQDPIVFFLLTSKQGHCEYFASAMVAMCRAVGINARMVTGYVAAEFNDASGAYLVRQSNAHAWVEIETGRDRWRHFDPTPPADFARFHRPNPGFLNRFKQMFDAVEFAWNSSVVGFTEKDRERLLGASEERSTGIAAFFDQISRRLQRGGPRLFIAAVATGVLVFAVVAVGGFGISLLARVSARLYRRLQPRRQAVDPVLAARLAQVGFYGEMLDLLDSRGIPKPQWSPPLQHASDLHPRDPDTASIIRTLASFYYRVRFGGADLSADERARAHAALATLKHPPAVS